jgi:hypothetical protein
MIDYKTLAAHDIRFISYTEVTSEVKLILKLSLYKHI